MTMFERPTTPAEVEQWLPHRPPMLLVDKVLHIDENTLVAERTFGADTVFFQGHFPPPDDAVLPGVIMLEGLVQAAALHTALTKKMPAGEASYRFTSAEKVTWKAPVLPGQTVRYEIEKMREKLGFFGYTGSARVENTICCTAQFMAKITPR